MKDDNNKTSLHPQPAKLTRLWNKFPNPIGSYFSDVHCIADRVHCQVMGISKTLHQRYGIKYVCVFVCVGMYVCVCVCMDYSYLFWSPLANYSPIVVQSESH